MPGDDRRALLLRRCRSRGRRHLRGGRRGSGIRLAARGFTPATGGPFDPYTEDGRRLLVTQCFDDACETGPRNGLWNVELTEGEAPRTRKLDGLPYAWGAQPVEALGVFLFTDGEDLLSVPLAGLMQTRSP